MTAPAVLAVGDERRAYMFPDDFCDDPKAAKTAYCQNKRLHDAWGQLGERLMAESWLVRIVLAVAVVLLLAACLLFASAQGWS